MNLMDLLKGQLTPDVIAQMSNETGASHQETATAAEGILSTLLGGLAKNAQTPQGASGILGALDRDHDGSILNDVMGMLSGASQGGNSSTLNGAGILGHILGGQQGNAAQVISQTSGVDQQGVMSMMLKFAPLIMGVLGQQKQQQGFDASGLASLLGGSVQNSSSNPLMQMATNFLDKNQDGSMMDDLMGMGSKVLGGFFKK